MTSIVRIGLFMCILITISSGMPFYEEENYSRSANLEELYNENQYDQPYVQIRERRSPQQKINITPPQQPQPSRGSVSVTGGHTSGSGGFVRGDYNHKLWEHRNGARLDANTYYQRNWGTPGPRQDYGGGVRLTVPLGGRRH